MIDGNLKNENNGLIKKAGEFGKNLFYTVALVTTLFLSYKAVDCFIINTYNDLRDIHSISVLESSVNNAINKYADRDGVPGVSKDEKRLFLNEVLTANNIRLDTTSMCGQGFYNSNNQRVSALEVSLMFEQYTPKDNQNK